MRTRLATSLVLATCALGVVAAVGSALAATRCAGHPSATATRTMLSTVHERLCYEQNAWLSGKNPHFGLIITQLACGGSHFEHWWLHRTSLSATAPWTVVDERRGTIDRRAGCSRVKRVPADIRCK
ncbi:MAG TPA: hypothetical protein VII83_00800 [Gaiellaceae bacterium]